MRKLLISLLALSGASSFAMANNLLQQFDNQYNLGYGMSATGMQNGAGSHSQANSQFINLEVERLFDAGVWMDVNANMVTSSNNDQPAGSTGAGSKNPLNQNFNLGGMNAKVGYGFSLAHQHLMITPYGLVGRNTNVAASTILANGQQNMANNDFFYTAGVGGRIEYRVTSWFDIYGDQNAAYNWDQSQPNMFYQPQNMTTYTSTLGAKFNIVKNLQLGANAFYTNYQYMAAAPTVGTGTTSSVYQPQSTVGGMITVGLTY